MRAPHPSGRTTRCDWSVHRHIRDYIKTSVDERALFLCDQLSSKDQYTRPNPPFTKIAVKINVYEAEPSYILNTIKIATKQFLVPPVRYVRDASVDDLWTKQQGI
jgi:hypothetical protein